MSVACLALLVVGCDTSAKNDQAKAASSATVAASAPPPVASTAEHAPKSALKPAKPERPRDLDPKLTPARRKKIDKAYPEAKGFVVMTDLQDKLKKEKSLKAKAEGMRAFDRMAKGKWVLFTGPLTEGDEHGFSLGVTYTPRVKGDVMGMSRQFFLVKLENIKGYQSGDMKNGTEVVVLARYAGKGKAGPGFELVAEHDW